jgi:hypothetical protein
MKSALFIITSVFIAAANAESANRVVGHHQDPQDEEGLRRVAEQRGAKLRGANSNQRMPGNNAYHHACILTESMSMSAPIFEAEASLSMPTRFVVPAEFSMSIPDLTPAAMEEEGADEGPIEEPVKMFTKSEKPGRRTLSARRHLMESMSMSAPIFEAEASRSMPTRFVVPAEFSTSIPDSTPAAMGEEGADEAAPVKEVGPTEEPVKIFAKLEKLGRRTCSARRHLMESMSMFAPIFEAEASLSMPTRFVVPEEFSMSISDSTPAAMEEESADEGPVEEPVRCLPSQKNREDVRTPPNDT